MMMISSRTRQNVFKKCAKTNIFYFKILSGRFASFNRVKKSFSSYVHDIYLWRTVVRFLFVPVPSLAVPVPVLRVHVRVDVSVAVPVPLVVVVVVVVVVAEAVDVHGRHAVGTLNL